MINPYLKDNHHVIVIMSLHTQSGRWVHVQTNKEAKIPEHRMDRTGGKLEEAFREPVANTTPQDKHWRL